MQHSDPNSLNILLVEDNDLDVEILKRGLKKLELTGALVRATDGVQALEILTDDLETRSLPQPLVILLDINMPRMDGHEFLAELRRRDDLRHAHVIVFTTSDSRKDVARAYQNNANGYIVKPNSLSELKNVLQALKMFWDACEHPCGPIT